MAGDRAFDTDAYLSRPLIARLATAGPTIRPIWFLWEEGAFWWLTGPWSQLQQHLTDNSRVALVVDTCDLVTGEVRQVIANGHAEPRPFDAQRARRKLRRYLGHDEQSWDARFQLEAMDMDRTGFIQLVPERLVARDLSFDPPPRSAGSG